MSTPAPPPVSSWSQLRTLAVSDLRQKVRDRSLFIFGLGVPLALITVFNLVFGAAEEVELRPVDVVVAAPSDDPMAQVVEDVLSDLPADGVELTLTRGEPDEVRAQVEQGQAHLGLVLPQGFTAAVRSGEATVVQAVQGEGRDVETQIVLSVVDGVLQQLAASTEAAVAAAEVGVPTEELEEVARRAGAVRPAYTIRPGVTSPEQLGPAAALVAGQTGLFLFFTVGFGVLGLVLERETGTLDRLRSMPMRPGLLVAAKALVSFLLGVATTSILLTVGGFLFEVGFGSVPAVAVLVVCASAAATSLMFVVVRVARTSEQASVAQSILALLLGVAGGAFFPLRASGLLGTLLELNPVAAFIRGLGITSGGGGVTDLGVPVASLLGFGLLMLAVARMLPDRGRP